jgi:hypothetical protein
VRSAFGNFSPHRQSRRRATSRAATQRREIALYDGRILLGHVQMLRGGKSFRAFDAAGRILEPSRLQEMRTPRFASR